MIHYVKRMKMGKKVNKNTLLLFYSVKFALSICWKIVGFRPQKNYRPLLREAGGVKREKDREKEIHLRNAHRPSWAFFRM